MTQTARQLGSGAIIAAAVVTFALPASAASNLTIRLTDFAGSITIADNGTGDTDLAGGIIDYDSTLGPVLPDGSHASVQSVIGPDATLSGSIEWDNSTTRADTLTLEISATDYTLPGLHWLGTHAFGGTTPETVTVEAFWSDSNTLFDPKYSIGGPFSYTHGGAAPFSGFGDTLSEFAIAGVNPFSMTTVVTITHGNLQAVISQVDTASNLSPVPVPAALPLLASAFGIMGALRLRRRRA